VPEVSDPVSWRRLCRIPLDRRVPHPTTLVKVVRRAGPEAIQQLNTALLAKLAGGKLLRARKPRVDTTVVEADVDDPTDADLPEHAVRKLGGLVRRVKARGAASRTRFRDRGRAAGRRMKQLARTMRRRTGVAMGEVDRLTGEVARIAGRTLREVQRWRATPAARLPAGPVTAGFAGWPGSWPRRSPPPSGCWPRPTSGLPVTG
jgi:IS5 family transposase